MKVERLNDLKRLNENGGLGRSEVEELFEEIERLSANNVGLHREIGRHANRVWEISEQNYKAAEMSKKLINDMLSATNV